MQAPHVEDQTVELPIGPTVADGDQMRLGNMFDVSGKKREQSQRAPKNQQD